MSPSGDPFIVMSMLPVEFRLTIAAHAGDPDPWELLPRIGATTVLMPDPTTTRITCKTAWPRACPTRAASV